MERLATWGVVAVFLQVTGRALDPLFGFWVPLYHPAKVAFVLWLIAPQSRGAARVFVKHVEPALERLEESMEELTATLDDDDER